MKTDFFKIFVLRTVGNFLLLSAVAGVFLTFLPALRAEVVYRRDQAVGQRYVLEGDRELCDSRVVSGQWSVVSEQNCPEKRTFGGLLNIAEPLSITPLDTNFGVVIPKINANARVIANVDAGNYNQYIAALKQGVAHAAGTVYPGQIGNTFLFAHSVGNFWEVNRWNAVFYLLRELSAGDEVNLFYLGRRYVYTVYDKKVVDPGEVGYIATQANFPMVTLQTCWPPGTTLKRLLVFGRLKGF